VYGPCLSAIVGGRALTPPTRRSLGRPLPYQQADGHRAAPKPLRRNVGALIFWITYRITPSFDELSDSLGYVPCLYSPVRHYPPLHATLELRSSKLICFQTACYPQVPTQGGTKDRSTCMLKARRQRSS
jgi:hypothetical protein